MGLSEAKSGAAGRFDVRSECSRLSFVAPIGLKMGFRKDDHCDPVETFLHLVLAAFLRDRASDIRALLPGSQRIGPAFLGVNAADAETHPLGGCDSHPRDRPRRTAVLRMGGIDRNLA
jgi:hypothetical protein